MLHRPFFTNYFITSLLIIIYADSIRDISLRSASSELMKKKSLYFCFSFWIFFRLLRGKRKQGIEFIQKQKAFIKLVCSRRLGAATFVFAIMKEIIKGGKLTERCEFCSLSLYWMEKPESFSHIRPYAFIYFFFHLP